MDYGTNGPVGPMGGGTGRTFGLQRFLISQGYNLTPDGRYGPLTAAAQKDWQSGIHNRNPQKWNAANAPHTTVPTQPAAAGGKTSAPRKPAGSGGGKSTPNPLADLPDFHFVNPASYAKNAVNAEYNPQIQELVRQKMAAGNQLAPNLANIQGWYDNALAELKEGGAAETKLADSLGDQATARSKNLIAAGGGDMAAAMGLLGSNQLDAEALSGAQFNTAMRGATAKAGAEASRDETARLQGMQNDLASQILAARGAKGSAYKTALDDAGQLRNQQLVAAQNYKAQQAMLPLEIKSKQLDYKTAKQQAADEHTSNLQQIMMNKLQLALGRQSLGNGGGPNATIPDFQNLDPSKRQGLRADLLKSAMGSGANPMQVYNMLGNSMRAYSNGKWNPHNAGQPQQFRDALMSEYVNYWNSTHPHAGQYVWGFTPGKAPVRGALRPKQKK